MELAEQTMKKLLREAGAEEVSDEAAQELADVLELYAGHLTEEAVGIVNDEQRKVIKADDIRNALE